MITLWREMAIDKNMDGDWQENSREFLNNANHQIIYKMK